VELKMIQEKKKTQMHNKERRNGEAGELING
jgi:hypothetical protein